MRVNLQHERSAGDGVGLSFVVSWSDSPPICHGLTCRFMPARFDRLDVIYEDNHLLAVNKAAELPTMGVAEDRESLLTVAKEYIAEKYDKPGNVYLGIV